MMKLFITQNELNLIRNIGIVVSCALCINAASFAFHGLNSHYGQYVIQLPNKKTIKTSLAITARERATGLSGLKKESFPMGNALLFVYKDTGRRVFGMPNTYFDLDIFFLDQGLRVLNVERNMPHHPGFREPPKIAATGFHSCRYVLELRSDDPLSKVIKKGSVLKWMSDRTLSEIISKTHLLK